jgi:hypothetical protein
VSASENIGFGSPQTVIFRRQISGTRVQLRLEDAGAVTSVTLGVTVIPESHYAQQITVFETEEPQGNPQSHKLVDWSTVQTAIGERPGLLGLAAEVGGLRGVRPLPPREVDYLGYSPDEVGFHGEKAAMMLLSAGADGLAAVNQWFERLHVRLSIKEGSDTFEVIAEGTATEKVNLVDSGAGIAQVLPLLVQLELADKMPRLWCIEQPELHLHPAAHAVVVEALLQRVNRDPASRILVETHSDAIVLRIRRELAAGRLTPDDVRVYFVDETQREGSVVTEIELTDEGTPTWWPKGVFAEPQEEYFAIRRELDKRRARDERPGEV